MSLGLFILPHRRSRAKAELKAKVADLRSTIMTALTDQFEAEAGRSRSRLVATISPYTRFVRAETDKLEGEQRELEDLADKVSGLQARVADLL